MPFAKGKSGNPGGRSRAERFVTEALVMEMKSRADDGDTKGMRGVARKIWDLAELGERWAAEFIRDTLDGKPTQQVDMNMTLVNQEDALDALDGGEQVEQPIGSVH